MSALEWSVSHAVYVAKIDDDHQEIFQILSCLQDVVASPGSASEASVICQELMSRIEDHFAHEERLMRASRYSLFKWHKREHDGARRRVVRFAARLTHREPDAGPALVHFVQSWLDAHTRLHDAMLGAHLRNHERGLWKISFRAGTRPAGSCTWRDSRGNPFDPAAVRDGS
jgi:hemerythrin